jgi:hypothetical protein
MRLFALIFVFLLMACFTVSAQDTETPEPTPSETATMEPTPSNTATPSATATNTLTATPELMVYMTLPAPATTGTPAAPQYVAVSLTATVGDIAIVIVGVALLVVILVGFAMGRK